MYRSPHRISGGSAGFSVLEMLVVVGVVGLVAVIGIPSLLSQLSKLRLESTANNIANLVRQTRLRAVRDNNEYTVEVSADRIVGMGVQGNLERVAPPPPGEPFWQGNGVIELVFDNPPVELYPGTWTAACQNKYDPIDPIPWGGDSITYDGTGVARDVGGGGTPGTGAFCIWDGGENVLQVVLEFPAGQPKVRKFLLAADSPTGNDGFFEKTSAATSGSVWVWY